MAEYTGSSVTHEQINGNIKASASRTPRTLVLCFDGTANRFDNENSNVAKFFSLLKKNVEDDQVVYYQPGPGTYFNPGAVSPIVRGSAKALDLAIAWYLDGHVKDGYRFLMQNYHGGDKMCLFGFSRGAYVARALAGFLTKCGLISKDNREQVHFAYELYKREDVAGIALAARFREGFARHVAVEFVDVWDTVASVGILRNTTLPFTDTNRGGIKTFRYALALDECRGTFQLNVWHRPSPQLMRKWTEGRKLAEGSVPAVVIDNVRPSQASDMSPLLPMQDTQSHPDREGPGTPSALEAHQASTRQSSMAFDTLPATLAPPSRLSAIVQKHAAEFRPRRKKMTLPTVVKAVVSAEAEGSFETDQLDRQPDTDVLECYFVGGHSDVGGGSVSNATQRSLSQITLRWMVRQVKLANCPIIFDKHAMRRHKIPVEHPQSLTLTQWEKQLDLEDIKAPLLDLLNPPGSKLPSVWWLTECLPLPRRWQTHDGEWKKEWKCNMGDGRRIRQPPSFPLLFHFTVQARMGDGSGYRPRAQWDVGAELKYVE